jgi:hypothetical protein
MSRLYYNNAIGTLAEEMGSGDGVFEFGTAPAFDTIVAPDYIPIALEPATTTPNANFEVVYLTAYTAGDTSGTVTRGQEGTSDIDHDSGVTWLCGPLADDLATSSGAATTITSNQQTADYTLALSDAGCVVELEGFSSSVLSSDSFTDADGTLLTADAPTIGAGWVLNPSCPDEVPVIESNLLTPTGSDRVAFNNQTSVPDDCDITVTIGELPDSNYTFTIYGRLAEDNISGYMVDLYPGDDKPTQVSPNLFRADSNGYTPLDSATDVATSVGDTFTLSMSGDTLTVLHNGTELFSVTDGTYTSGQAGLGIYDSGSLSEFEVVNPSGDTPHESLYVPPHADVPFPEGTIVELCDVGPSLPIVIQAESGVTLDIPPAASVTSPGQWSTARLRQRFIDEWVVDNDWALSTGGATPVTTIVQDSFTDVDGTAVSAHVPEIGGGWNLEGSSTHGGSHIFGDRLEVNGNSFLLSQATPPSADYQVSCQFYGLGSGSSSNVGVFVRASEDADGQTGYTLIMTSGGLYLQYFVDGTYEGSLAGPLSGTDGDTWTLRIEGETLTVLQNGTEVWSGADSTITQVGTVAVGGGWDGSEPVYMDNLVATTLA